jgi:transposase
MFLPTYSSVLNPIEKVWNVVKQEWRQTQHLHALREFLDMEDCSRYSLDRLRAIVGKDKMLKKSRFTLRERPARHCPVPHGLHGALHQRGHCLRPH